jgi:hypothetical protein
VVLLFWLDKFMLALTRTVILVSCQHFESIDSLARVKSL